MDNKRVQLIFFIIFSFVNVGLYLLAVDQEKRGEILSPTYWNTPDGQRYWGAAINLAERGQFTVRTAGPTIRYRYIEKERPNPDLPLSEAVRLPRKSRTVSEEPLARAGPLPALLFSIPIKIVGFDRAPAFIVSFQCALLFALSLLVRSLAAPFRCNGNILQGLLIFNPNLIGLAHHAQSELIFVFLFTVILWFCSRLLTASKPATHMEIILFGLCIGLLPLARPLGLYLIVAIPILLLISLWIQSGSFRVRYLNFQKLIFISLIASLVVLPWSVRNYAVFGEFTLTQSEGIMMQWHYTSMKLYLGEGDSRNNLADVISPEDSEKLNECNSVRGPKCRQLAAVEYFKAIVDRSPSDLIYALSSSWVKLLFSGGATQIANYIGIDRPDAHNFLYGKTNWYHSSLKLMKEFLRNYQLFSVIFLFCMAFAAIARTLGIIGLAAVQGRHLWSITVFYLFLITIFLLMYLFSGIGRFRAPLEPILMLYAAIGISFLFHGRTPLGRTS